MKHESKKARTDEWLTPPTIVTALGTFDLDPCSPINRPWDTALHHYSILDDGLRSAWDKEIYLNFGKFDSCELSVPSASVTDQPSFSTKGVTASVDIQAIAKTVTPNITTNEKRSASNYYRIISNDAQNAKLISHVTKLILVLERTKKHYPHGAGIVSGNTLLAGWQEREMTLQQRLKFWLQRLSTVSQIGEEQERENIVLSAITNVDALLSDGHYLTGSDAKTTLETNVPTVIPVQHLHKIIIFLYQTLSAPAQYQEILYHAAQNAIPQNLISIRLNGANQQLLSQYNDILPISLRLTKKQRVWLNPPYGNICERWMCKMSGYDSGIALIFARTETGMFFEYGWKKAESVFFFEGRLSFYTVAGKVASGNAGAPSCLISYGENNGQAISESGLIGKHIPLKYTPMIIVGISPSWKDVVKIVLTRTGTAALETIYKMVEEIAPDKIQRNQFYKEKVRQTLQQHFNRKDRGTYTLFN